MLLLLLLLQRINQTVNTEDWRDNSDGQQLSDAADELRNAKRTLRFR
jgi:hypothetical protein